MKNCPPLPYGKATFKSWSIQGCLYKLGNAWWNRWQRTARAMYELRIIFNIFVGIYIKVGNSTSKVLMETLFVMKVVMVVMMDCGNLWDSFGTKET